MFFAPTASGVVIIGLAIWWSLVEDVKENGRKGKKGYAVGTDNYNKNVGEGFSLWFYRRSDAMKFIKTWSQYRIPTTYFDYFRDIRKEIDLNTRKLRVVEEFTLL